MDNPAFCIQGEGTRTRVDLLAVLLHGKETIALDGQIHSHAGDFQLSLIHEGVDGGDAHAVAQLELGIQTHTISEQGSKTCAPRLEARGVHIHDIAADDIQATLMPEQTGGHDVKTAQH